ncbi:MAG TPA: hypothetical protein ENG05_03460 [Acidilobales archaeon]|nr:hypothetical protein [Acidilobales archaeon]
MQRKYPSSWRFIKHVRDVRRRWFTRAKNILRDSCHYISRSIAKIAREYDALIVLEDLSWIRFRTNGGSRFNWENMLWCYRRIRKYVHYKALINGFPVLHVNSKNSSKTSPLGGKLEFINYRWVKLPSGVVTSRDVVASRNCSFPNT